MTVHVVVKPGAWILNRMAQELADRLPNVTVYTGLWPPPDPGRRSWPDVTYCLPAKNVCHLRHVNSRLVGFFTHGEDRARADWQRFEVCLAMNQRMAVLLRELGARDVRVIRPGADPPPRPIVFGVCGRAYGSQREIGTYRKGRKGVFLIRQAVEAGYQVRACSDESPAESWPCPITHRTEQRAAFYQTIDYLVVPSLDEGGPMAVPEAIAHGVPVIAPDVGFAWEFPGIRYQRGSWASLQSVLEALTRPPSWQAWALGHQTLFADLEARR